MRVGVFHPLEYFKAGINTSYGLSLLTFTIYTIDIVLNFNKVFAIMSAKLVNAEGQECRE